MEAVREVKEKVQLSREEEQEKRYFNYQKDRESLEVSRLEDERFRVDNMITGGVYFVKGDSKTVSCNCPDFEARCSGFTPALKCKHIIAAENWKSYKEKGMEEHNFNPQNHLIKIDGKNYLEVKFRLHWFRMEHKNWDIKTEIIQLDMEKGMAAVRADIFDEKGNHRSSGIKIEYKHNYEDYCEKAETGAEGRALSALGYGTLQAFDFEEGIEKGRIADSPVSIENDKGNGKVMFQIEEEQSHQESSIELCYDYKGNNGSNGNGNGNGNGKASLRQVRYLKDLCKDLNIKPGIEISGLSREKASQFISDLERMRTKSSN